MPFNVLIPRKVEKEILSLPESVIENILLHLKTLVKNPFPQNSKKLQNRSGYRLRVGEYRIIYEVDPNKKVITIFRVAHRKDIYKR